MVTARTLSDIGLPAPQPKFVPFEGNCYRLIPEANMIRQLRIKELPDSKEIQRKPVDPVDKKRRVQIEDIERKVILQQRELEALKEEMNMLRYEMKKIKESEKHCRKIDENEGQFVSNAIDKHRDLQSSNNPEGVPNIEVREMKSNERVKCKGDKLSQEVYRSIEQENTECKINKQVEEDIQSTGKYSRSEEKDQKVELYSKFLGYLEKKEEREIEERER